MEGVCLDGEGEVIEVKGIDGGELGALNSALGLSGDRCGVDGEEAEMLIFDNLARTRIGPLVLLVEIWLPAVLDAVLVRRTLLNLDCPGCSSPPRLRLEELGLELR